MEEPCSSGWCLKVACRDFVILIVVIIVSIIVVVIVIVVTLSLILLSSLSSLSLSHHSSIATPQILEGRDKNFGDDDFGIATERQCLQRPPSDNTERFETC